jgi:hypothetical protein
MSNSEEGLEKNDEQTKREGRERVGIASLSAWGRLYLLVSHQSFTGK